MQKVSNLAILVQAPEGVAFLNFFEFIFRRKMNILVSLVSLTTYLEGGSGGG